MQTKGIHILIAELRVDRFTRLGSRDSVNPQHIIISSSYNPLRRWRNAYVTRNLFMEQTYFRIHRVNGTIPPLVYTCATLVAYDSVGSKVYATFVSLPVESEPPPLDSTSTGGSALISKIRDCNIKVRWAKKIRTSKD